jgi:hypothetical protein
MVRAAGFDKVDAWKLTDKPTHVSHCRGFARGAAAADRRRT